MRRDEMAHDCVTRVNEKLALHNTKLAEIISLSEKPRELIQVTTTKRNAAARGKPVAMFASYCPFCGAELNPGS